MTARTVRYSVGNENNPSDPWGRSELVVEPDGSVRLDHHFSRVRQTSAWTGRVAASALDEFWAALDRAGFPAGDGQPFVAGATLRRLTVESDGTTQQAFVDWHRTPSLPGYAEAFDILDGVIRQLSGGSVAYPSGRSDLVSSVTPVPD